MSDQDMSIGFVVLTGDANYHDAPLWKLVAAWLFGERQRFVHLGKQCTVCWWRDDPYLMTMRDARE